MNSGLLVFPLRTLRLFLRDAVQLHRVAHRVLHRVAPVAVLAPQRPVAEAVHAVVEQAAHDSGKALRPDVDGEPIYVVYFGPFAFEVDACTARADGPEGAYAKQLSNDIGPDQVVNCG